MLSSDTPPATGQHPSRVRVDQQTPLDRETAPTTTITTPQPDPTYWLFHEEPSNADLLQQINSCTVTLNNPTCVLQTEKTHPPLSGKRVYQQFKRSHENIHGKVLNISTTRTGKIFVSATQAFIPTILKLTQIDDIPVRACLTRGSYARVCIIKGVPVELHAQEIYQLLKEDGQHPISVQRFSRKLDGQIIPTGTIKISLVATELPRHLRIYLMAYRVEPYEERPRLCQQCGKLGHTKKFCRGVPRCKRCGDPQHDKECTAEVTRCINCNGDHAFTSPLCPSIQYEKAILRHQRQYNCSRRDARAAIHPPPDNNRSYSTATQQPSHPQNQTHDRPSQAAIQRASTDDPWEQLITIKQAITNQNNILAKLLQILEESKLIAPLTQQNVITTSSTIQQHINTTREIPPDPTHEALATNEQTEPKQLHPKTQSQSTPNETGSTVEDPSGAMTVSKRHDRAISLDHSADNSIKINKKPKNKNGKSSNNSASITPQTPAIHTRSQRS
ncbi:uncharacterized protein LOC111617786 [Centruroides sculpturatus]|uniref:uncharacterized protein LOC111617786 n=1 Tax=Centruroides sculpturatus TaxID=218467 RepID=UPI000C6C8ABA|nr:uncharacterized protein LOC111617786 [Centruroides sculpturatus]